MGRVHADMLELIGHTPMVRLDRLTAGLAGSIVAKLEYFNPGFSKKDRIALQIIEDAVGQGWLAPGQPVVELTSGSTGIGLAIVCSLKGYPFIAVMSKGNSVERAKMMRAFGAEVVLVDQATGSPPGQVSGEDLALVEAEARRLTAARGAFRVDQFYNKSNAAAHELNTGEEMWRQTGGEIDVFVDFAGTAGTFMGCARALKKHNPAVRCYLVEPRDATYLETGRVVNASHRIQGGGYAMELPLLDRSLVAGFLAVSDEEAVAATRRLAREEGILAGFSSGANVAAALSLLADREKGRKIAVIINDIGLKYMSNDLFV